MNINWDEIANEASDTPRALLAEVLARADEIAEIVIVWHDKDGIQNVWQNTRNQAMTIAMLEYAKWKECMDIRKAVE